MKKIEKNILSYFNKASKLSNQQKYVKRYLTVNMFFILLLFFYSSANLLGQGIKKISDEQQNNFQWPEEQLGAVTLSYDDANSSHFKTVAPQLEKAGLRGTFYITVGSGGFMKNTEEWRRIAKAGHELGNHSIFHPCRIDSVSKYKWKPKYNLSSYTPRRWRDEMRVANFVLNLIDGKTERTFANTCNENYLGPVDSLTCLEDLAPEFFIAARGEKISKPIDPLNANFMALGLYSGDRRTFEQLREEIEEAVSQGKWIFYMFHGVGKGSHPHYIETEEHQKLIDYLAANRDRIWTGTAIEVVKYIKEK